MSSKELFHAAVAGTQGRRVSPENAIVLVDMASSVSKVEWLGVMVEDMARLVELTEEELVETDGLTNWSASHIRSRLAHCPLRSRLRARHVLKVQNRRVHRSLVSTWCFRLVSDWFPTGFRVVSDWFPTGFRLVSDWFPIYLSIDRSTYLSIDLSIDLSIYLYLYLSIYIYLYLSKPIYLSI